MGSLVLCADLLRGHSGGPGGSGPGSASGEVFN